MTDITEEQWQALKSRRSQWDLQFLLVALEADGTVTISGNSEPPELPEDAPEDTPEPYVTTQQAEEELTALYTDLQLQAAEEEEEVAAPKAAPKEKAEAK